MSSRLKYIGILAAVMCFALPATAAMAEDGVAARSGTLRAGPGTNFPSIDQVSRGDDLNIYGCTEDYAWCDVSVNDERGWFPGSRIDYLDDGREVVISEVGPSIGIAILGFSVGEYWGAHYHNRSFYRQERRFENFNRYSGPGRPQQPGPRPGVNAPRPGFNRPPGQPFVAPNQQAPRPQYQPQQQRSQRPDQVDPRQQHVRPPRPQFEQQAPRPQVQAPRPQPQVQAPRPQVQAPRPQPQVQAPRPQPQVQAPRGPAPARNCGKGCLDP